MSHGSACSVVSGNSIWSPGFAGSSRTMSFPISSVNQTFPSGPVAMNVGNCPMPLGYSSMIPFCVILPTWSTFSSVNQRSPFGRAVMSQGCASGVGSGHSVISPCGVIRPIWLRYGSVNRRLPSAPTVIPYGPLSCHSSGNSVRVPLGVMRPIVPRLDSVNQRFPSGPATIVYGRLSACGSGNSVTSERAAGARNNASPAATSVEAIHGLSTALPPETARIYRSEPRLPSRLRECALEAAAVRRRAVRREYKLDGQNQERMEPLDYPLTSHAIREPLLQDLDPLPTVDQRVSGDDDAPAPDVENNVVRVL